MRQFGNEGGEVNLSQSGPVRADRFDAIVVGAGFGGLGCALSLAERGARVCLLEQLNYPGGCASTFSRKGYRFEAGATLFSGFGPGQPFDRWMRTHGMNVQVDFIDPLVELRTPQLNFQVPSDRRAFIDRMVSLPGAPKEKLEAFFRYQAEVAAVLWTLLSSPERLPPFGWSELWQHVRCLPKYLPLLRLVGRSLSSVLRRFELQHFEPLRVFLEALCQITVQCSANQAEAPFALGTMDYYFQGTGHVRGGIGVLAEGMLTAIERCGGEVRLATRVKGLRHRSGTWVVDTRNGSLEAPELAVNLLPEAVSSLLGYTTRPLQRRARAVSSGWGAAMLYLVANAPARVDEGAHHLELVPDPKQSFIEGHHLFCSISGADEARAGPGQRTLTVSTHVPLKKLRSMTNDEQAAFIQSVQDRMRSGLSSLAPEWWKNVVFDMPASPRTFERFTGRPYGYVGGIPKCRGLSHYFDLIPAPPLPGLYLVGDSVFPGQSTLATAIGGRKVADRMRAGRARAPSNRSPMSVPVYETQ